MRQQGEGDAALWLLACLLALWTPPEPFLEPLSGQAVPPEQLELPSVDELIPLYGVMRQVRTLLGK